MSVVVVLLVTLLAFFYVRGMRMARQQWLQKLDLPGRWLLVPSSDHETAEQEDTDELTLRGSVREGDFVRMCSTRGKVSRSRGRWRVVGHSLELQADGETVQSLQLHMFKPGEIGLEDGRGLRRIYQKTTDNVVPLRRRG